MANIINLKPRVKEEKAVTKQPQQEKPMVRPIKWQAAEFEYFEKSEGWLIASGLVALVFFIWAVFSKNFLLVIFVSLGYAIFIIYAFKKPKKIDFSITSAGITIDQTLHKYDSLKSFCIFADSPLPTVLSLRSKKKLMPYLKIPLDKQNHIAIQTALKQYLPQRKHKESIVDSLSRNLKF